MRRVVTALLVVAAGFVSVPAMAAPIVFAGGDSGANSTDPRPVSDATAAAFDLAAGGLGSLNLIDFESAPLGTYASLAIAPGVTLTGTDFTGDSGGQSIRNSAFGSPDSVFGYNTTSGGSQFAFINGGFLTFSFATPVQAFGAYLTGLQLDGETITFNDGSAETINIPNQGSGAQFVGFTDAGKLIASIRVDTTSAASPLGDFVGVDDVRYVNNGEVAAVPEPASLLLAGSGLLALARRRYGRKRA